MKFQTLAIFVSLCILSSCSKKHEKEDAIIPSGYKVVSVTNAGTVKGTVKTDAAQKYIVNIETQKDQDVCGASHKNLSLPSGNGGVPNCIIGIESISQGKDFVKKEYTLDQHGCDFLPHTQIVKLGAPIVVMNTDAVIHNYHVNLNGQTVLNEAQPEGAPAREVRLKQKGLHVVSCDIHPWMKGFIFMADNPYYVLSDSTGAFSIADIPPGKYKLTMWRDNWNVEEAKNKSGNIESYNWGKDFTKEQEITVEAGKDVTVDFTLP